VKSGKRTTESSAGLTTQVWTTFVDLTAREILHPAPASELVRLLKAPLCICCEVEPGIVDFNISFQHPAFSHRQATRPMWKPSQKLVTTEHDLYRYGPYNRVIVQIALAIRHEC
jgi:hypothetical protein